MSINSDYDNIIIQKLNLFYNEINEKFLNIDNKINEINNKLVENITFLNEIKKKNNNNDNHNAFNEHLKQYNHVKQCNYKKQNKTYNSASLTFIDDELGYLMCEEFRYKEKKNLIHPIGGRVETFDNELIDTGIREFIEETNLLQYPYLYINKLDKNILINSIKNIIKSKIDYIDLCINKDLEYYHRYYIYNLSFLSDTTQEINEFKKSIKELPIFFNGNYKTEVNNLQWLNNSNNLDVNNSHLTKMFLKNINKNINKKYKK